MRSSVLLTLCIPLLLQAQTWCPPSAIWTYSFENFTSTGYTRFTCIGDTTIGEAECQKVLREVHYYDFISSTYVSGTGPRYCTRNVAGLITLWDGAAFDTLYDFNALPGSSWRLPNDGSYPTDRTVNVLSTGTSELNGTPLQWLHVTLDGFPTDTIFERIGGPDFYWLPWEMNIVDGFAGSLRCYEDLEFQYDADPSRPCDIILEVHSERSIAASFMSPNPGSDVVFVGPFTADGSGQVDFIDASGRILVTAPFNSGHALDVSALPSGMFIYEIRTPNEPVKCRGRWVKT